jgi:hypothetical protein
MNTLMKIIHLVGDTILMGAIILLTGHVLWSWFDTNQVEERTEQAQYETKNIGALGEGWHYAIPHGTGNELENTNGCPCVTLALGYSSYANMTNAIIHGYRSVFEELKKMKEAKGDTSGVCKIVDILAVEAYIMKQIKEESK